MQLLHSASNQQCSDGEILEAHISVSPECAGNEERQSTHGCCSSKRPSYFSILSGTQS